MKNLKELFRLMSLTTAWHALGTMAENRLDADNAAQEEIPLFQGLRDTQAWEAALYAYVKDLEVKQKAKLEHYMIGYAQLLAFAGLWSFLVTVVWSIPAWAGWPWWCAPAACLGFAASISAWEFYDTYPARVLYLEALKNLQVQEANLRKTKKRIPTEQVSEQEPQEP